MRGTLAQMVPCWPCSPSGVPRPAGTPSSQEQLVAPWHGWHTGKSQELNPPWAREQVPEQSLLCPA